MSASCSQRPGTRPVSFVHAARTCAGVHSLVEEVAGRVAERELLVGEREAHGLAPRQAEHTLGDHVALDLVGARVDRARRARTRSPSSTPRRRRRAARRAGRAGRARARAAGCRAPTRTPSPCSTPGPVRAPSAIRVTVQNVCQRYASASIHAADEAVARVDRLGVVAVRAGEVDEPLRGGHEAAGRAQREPALRAGGRHRDAPSPGWVRRARRRRARTRRRGTPRRSLRRRRVARRRAR